MVNSFFKTCVQPTGKYLYFIFSTWLRISDMNERSMPYELEDGTIFKIGNTITYICKY